MYKHILVGISFEEGRDRSKALAVAQQLRGADGRITLLHVMEQVPSYAMAYMQDGFREKSRMAITETLEETAHKVGGAGVAVVEGHSGQTLLEWADANGVDCIVIASHRPGVQDYFLGSTAARVVRHANCAVHVIR